MKIGVIIRTTGERTEALCRESVKLLTPDIVRPEDILIVRDYFPFWKAVKRTMEQAIHSKFDHFFGLDADIILRKDCVQKISQFLNDTDISRAYRVDFPVRDRFTKQLLYGIHFYNAKFCKCILEKLEQTKFSNKPEGNIRNLVSAPEIKTDWALGYHGYEQYYTDIFNRFIVRARRNPEFVKKYNVFQKDSPEVAIGKFGWQYGLTLGNSEPLCLDASNKIKIEQYGYTELAPLIMDVKAFHKKWCDYVP